MRAETSNFHGSDLHADFLTDLDVYPIDRIAESWSIGHTATRLALTQVGLRRPLCCKRHDSAQFQSHELTDRRRVSSSLIVVGNSGSLAAAANVNTFCAHITENHSSHIFS
jgi:hypothetical protein